MTLTIKPCHKKVVCTNPNRCEMCVGPAFGYARGRAYTATAEARQGKRHGYRLAEIDLGPHWFHCGPHFQEITKADEDIFALADRPIRTRVHEKEDA